MWNSNVKVQGETAALATRAPQPDPIEFKFELELMSPDVDVNIVPSRTIGRSMRARYVAIAYI